MLNKFLISTLIASLLINPIVSKAEIKKHSTLNATGEHSDEKYILVANESTEENSSPQYSGSFNRMKMDKGLQSDSYKIDAKIPVRALKEKKALHDVGFEKQSEKIGKVKSFYVESFLENEAQTTDGKLLYIGSKVQIWTDVTNGGISVEDAEKVAKEFDEKIYPKVSGFFGKESDVNTDGKIDLFFNDIQDDFSKEKSGPFISGYFNPNDLISNAMYSNHSEVLYIDTYPTLGIDQSQRDISKSFRTIAHEFQHLINYNRNVRIEKGAQMDAWMDEGLAMAAEQAYSGKVLENRIDYYNRSESIKKGHSLLVWDDEGDVLSNYSLSYLFFQYIRIQSGNGESIYREILDDPNNNYKAVEKIIHKNIDQHMSFSSFLVNFHKALFLKDKTGLLGFKGEEGFDRLTTQIYDGPGTYLKSGGALFRKVTNAIPTDKGQSVTYFIISKGYRALASIKDVSIVNESSQSIKGSTSSNVTVKALIRNQEFISTSDENGNFEIKIPKQVAGTIIQLFTVDLNENKGGIVEILVEKILPPTKPKLNKVKENTTILTGTSDPNNSIIATIKGKTYSTKANELGIFQLNIPKQKAGSVIKLYAENEYGKKSVIVEYKVEDSTPPLPPVVNQVTSKATSVIGKAEKGVTVYIYSGNTFVGKAIVNTKGKFSIKIKKLKKGTVLNVYAVDRSKNKSKVNSLIVK